MKPSEIPLIGEENYSYLQKMWEQEKMQSFKDFLRCYNNIDVVPPLEAMQKMVEFYHNKGIDILKIGCILPNLANICLHSSTSTKCYHFTGSDKDLFSKFRKDLVGGASKDT